MIQMSNQQFDQLFLALLDSHQEAYPDDPKLAGARATLRRDLRKRLGDNEDPSHNHQAYVCNNRRCGTRFWVAHHDGDAVCPRCGDLTGME